MTHEYAYYVLKVYSRALIGGRCLSTYGRKGVGNETDG